MSSLDINRQDIASLRSELTLLTRKRALLEARLAQLKCEKHVVLRPSVGLTQSTLSDELLERDKEQSKQLLAHISAKFGKQRDFHMQNLYRLAGVTSFKVKDPSFNGHGDNLLGIRIECFALKKFGAPHYVILAKDEKTGSYRIFKHTIPLYIPLADLAEKYLARDLHLFVRKLRTYVILDLQKRTHLSCLSNVTLIEADEACELVKLHLEFPESGSCVAYLRCNYEDVVSAVVLRTNSRGTNDDLSDRSEDAIEDDEPVRDRKLEALLEGKISLLQSKCSRIL